MGRFAFQFSETIYKGSAKLVAEFDAMLCSNFSVISTLTFT